jgi:putative ABC transport system permease protein
MFDSRDIQTLSQDERSFQTSFLAGISAVLLAINVISGVILVIMALILGNTVAMGVRERTSEYGVLRAIGFSPAQVAAFVFGEAVLIAGVGAAVGLLLAYPFIEQGLGRFLEENMGSFFPFFRISPVDSVLAVVFALAVGFLAALIPARGVAKLQVTEALRRVV